MFVVLPQQYCIENIIVLNCIYICRSDGSLLIVYYDCSTLDLFLKTVSSYAFSISTDAVIQYYHH